MRVMTYSPLFLLATGLPLETLVAQGGSGAVILVLCLAVKHLWQTHKTDQETLRVTGLAHKDQINALVQGHRDAVDALTKAHRQKLDAIHAERVEELRTFVKATQALEKRAAMMSDSAATPRPRRTTRS